VESWLLLSPESVTSALTPAALTLKPKAERLSK